MKNHLIFLFSFVFFALSCSKPNFSEIPYFNSAEFEPEWLSSDDLDSDDQHLILPFSFTNQNGEIVNNETLAGQFYIANFFFTICPSICPTMMQNMGVLQDYYLENKNVALVSHTVTPWIDSVEVLKKYAIDQQINSDKWHLLTGKKEEIYAIARTSYFADKELGLKLNENDFLHTENFILIDINKHIRGIYNGTKLSDIERLKTDLNILLHEFQLQENNDH